MSRSSSRRRRLVAALVLVLLVAGVGGAASLTLGPRETIAQEPAPLRVEAMPLLGARLLGGAAAAGPGEAWAARPSRTVDGVAQPFLLRYRRDEGWRVTEPAVDEQGRAYDGGTLREGRVTARGGLLLVADDDTRPAGRQRVVMVRDADGPARVAPAPADGVLLPADGSVPAEQLSDGAIAARDAGGATEGFLGIVGRPLQTGVARWAGGAWSREPLCVAADAGGTPPAGCAPEETLRDSHTALSVVALATAEGGGAWALARADTTARRGLVLFERVDDGTPRWRLREIGAPLFAAAATPARAVDSVAPRATGFALTATADAVWLDGSFRFRAEARDVTVRVDAAGTRTWCDAVDTSGPLCDHPLGFRFRDASQSIAWPGSPGSRVVGPVSLAGGATTYYASLQGDEFVLRPTFAGLGPRLAFAAPDEGWFDAVHLTRDPWSSPIAEWSVPLRRPLTAIAGRPGATPGDLGAEALAVGMRGTIVRYRPGQGWDSEALIASGGIATPNLRGVAWPEADVAYAVGDEGTMWRWRRATDLWEPDPAAPFDFVGQLTGVAFAAGSADRGYAVGRTGVLLRYGKSWEQEPLPPEVQTGGPYGGPVDFTSVAFAGSQALVAAGRHLLVDDGTGWRADPDAAALIARAGPNARIVAVAGLPDGGAVAAGTGIAIERDGPGAPWRASAQPPPGTVVAVAAFREDGAVRALASVSGDDYPQRSDLEPPVIDPQAPPPRLPAFLLPGDGDLLRETAGGWRAEERASQLKSPADDGARKADPVLALLADPAGRAWTVGGWNGRLDAGGRGTDPSRDAPRAVQETASIARYDPAGPPSSVNLRPAAVAQPAGPARFAVGGGARCRSECAALAPLDLAPDRMLSGALALAGRMRALPNGPRALLYTGGRAAVGGLMEQQRFAQLLAAAPLPVLPAVADGEAPGGASTAYEQAFAGFPAPLGDAPAAAGVHPLAIGAAPSTARARTHYAVDTDGPEGSVRVVVIDNATGSLAARDGGGNPAQDQKAWLRAVLLDARQKGIPAVVVGNRSLSTGVDGGASDAAEVAAILRDGGASAYVHEGSSEQRATAIPTGSGEVPQLASGSLGYRSPTAPVPGYDAPGLLLLELDLAGRDPATNRAPVSARLIPVIEDLAMEAVDGRILNRSQPALFRGLGRRPRSGDPEDQYVALPNDPCRQGSQCPDRIDPEVRFTSSDPDIAQFVRLDRSSPNPRKPYVDPATDKVVPDATSGLLCAFNAGTTTVTIESGGLAYSTTVTVRDGSVLRPCGTMPLDPRRFPSVPPSRPAVTPPPPPPPNAAPRDDPPPVAPPPPPPPVREPVVAPPPPARAAPPRPQPRAQPQPRPQPEPNPVPAAVALPGLVPLAPLPPPPSVARPIPPSGTAPVSVSVPVAQPVAQIERQREEEEALEQSQAYTRVSADHEPGRVAAPLLVLVLLAAAGAGALRRPRRDRSYAYADDRHRRFRR